AAAARSSTSTRAPVAAALTAAQPPPMPKPITSTSTSSDQDVTVSALTVAGISVLTGPTPLPRTRELPPHRFLALHRRRRGSPLLLFDVAVERPPLFGNIGDLNERHSRLGRRHVGELDSAGHHAPLHDRGTARGCFVQRCVELLRAFGLHADVVQTRPTVA